MPVCVYVLEDVRGGEGIERDGVNSAKENSKFQYMPSTVMTILLVCVFGVGDRRVET